MQLSKNFALHEFTRSTTAKRLGIDNTPNQEQINSLKALCENVLEPIRERYARPVHINSGFRCKRLNGAIRGSSKTSQHQTGEAADIEVFELSNYMLAVWISENLEFDQVILEYHNSKDPYSGWVHVSYRQGENRRQILSKTKTGSRIGEFVYDD